MSRVFREWGLHHALLANEVTGASKEFEKLLEINGLGYKAAVAGSKIILTLGYSHKIDCPLPKEVSVTIDKSGQNISVKSTNKFLAGDVAQKICALRRPEPYKGTGIRLANKQILRKVGKS